MATSEKRCEYHRFAIPGLTGFQRTVVFGVSRCRECGAVAHPSQPQFARPLPEPPETDDGHA